MRYFIGFLITVGLIILLIFMLFHGGGKPKVTTTSKVIDSYATTDAEARLTTDGPVNANQEHIQTRITVSRDDVTYEELKGYDGEVTKQLHFSNTQNSYAAFLISLGHAGFTLGDNSKQLSDERGYCATGERYIFELRQDSRDIERYWATSCGGTKTYAGSLELTTDLFHAQIPDYNTLAENINL
jgi:hypothetical protein